MKEQCKQFVENLLSNKLNCYMFRLLNSKVTCVFCDFFKIFPIYYLVSFKVSGQVNKNQFKSHLLGINEYSSMWSHVVSHNVHYFRDSQDQGFILKEVKPSDEINNWWHKAIGLFLILLTQKITFLFQNVTNKGTDICAVNTKKCRLPDTG